MRSGSKRDSPYRGMRRKRRRRQSDSVERRQAENRVLLLIPARKIERTDGGTAVRTITRENTVETSVKKHLPPAQA